jgi:hypothetical protein
LLTLAKGDDGGDEIEECREAGGGLVVTGGDASEMLDTVDEALDQVAFLVEVLVVGDRLSPARIWRDHGGGAELDDGRPDAIGIVSLVSDDVLAGLAIEQGLGLGRIMGLAGGQDDPDQLADGVDEEMQLAAQAAARAANRLSVRAPFAPAAC